MKEQMPDPLDLSVRLRELEDAIYAWRSNNKQGYDTAISLICKAEMLLSASRDALDAQAREIAALTQEREHYHAHYDAALANWNEVLAEVARLRTALETARVEVEKNLEWLEKESYIFDRQKAGLENPSSGLSCVNDAIDAMHALLFVKAALAAFDPDRKETTLLNRTLTPLEVFERLEGFDFKK
ncbi:MAG: hypothetical protein WC655_17205 [Candidatus Hydrogenedentales bacterium]|jgi:septation ring formation regulator EzrA